MDNSGMEPPPPGLRRSRSPDQRFFYGMGHFFRRWAFPETVSQGLRRYIKEFLALVRRRMGASWLFSLGVGTAVNRYLLEEMAAMGRGAVQVMRPDQPAAAVVEHQHRGRSLVV